VQLQDVLTGRVHVFVRHLASAEIKQCSKMIVEVCLSHSSISMGGIYRRILQSVVIDSKMHGVLGISFIAFAPFVGIAIAVYMFGKISMAHFNL